MFFPLLQNLILLIGLALVFLLFAKGDRTFSFRDSPYWKQILVGAIVSGLGLAVMATKVPLTDGVVFDARSVLLAATGLFFGAIPTAMAALATIAFRMWEGGSGTFPGILVILFSAGIGLVARHFRRDHLAELRTFELYGLGLLVHVGMVAIIAISDPGLPPTFWTTVVPIVIVFYPLAFLALTKLLTLHLQEERHRIEELRLTRAVEQSPVSIVMTDPEGIIQYVNPFFTEVSGYGRDEAVGQSTRILNAGVQTEEFYRRLWITIKAGRSWSGEFCNRRKDGSLFWEMARISPINDGKGVILGYLAVKQDITEEKARADELEIARRKAEESAEAKQSFLSVISHELRTPLNQIIGPCELVLEEVHNPQHQALLRDAVDASSRLLYLVETILDYSASSYESERVPSRIADAMFWLEGLFRPLETRTAAKGFSFTSSLEAGFPRGFVANRRALELIAEGYLDNALKFGSPGKVKVSLAPAGQGRGILRVENEGPCPVGSEKDKLFQPFSQIDMGLSRAHEGVGLGLALCRRRAENVGATVGMVEGDRGPVFYCEFPMDACEDLAERT